MCYSLARELWDSVTEYFHSLKRVWQDHDLFNTCKQKTTKDAKHQQQTVGGRTFQFLVGLNKELDEIHGRIIGRAVSSSLEPHRNVIMGKTKVDPPSKTNALVAKATSP
ncbi:hypothetical protein PHAVU_001G088500 [Phaseolus vulgaris]|uniref:Uncharacterized protein n=1 Tax=Phaseolus vulgaris TaxID=3885 RepID=V7CWN2_PHAVU|nr:hypothetical protein PHAVU_001G088500g [Phaseolus vulgaris]ESW33660.1 hypothetical protein PHAVU_001G088500g [Phaseolus vulgaris]